jgi:2-dehydro-3-deoxyphosphooctonate aldolase (KDO 8-P synthase)
MSICGKIKNITDKLGITYIFKGSFDKANRTSLNSFRGLGLDKGLEILHRVKEKYQVPVLTDVHETNQCNKIAEIVDIIQIPALLSRQTDLITNAAKTGKIINIKKGQFMAPWDMKHAIEKAVQTGNHKVIITERGTCFGYNNIVVDFRSFAIMKEFGKPVVFDASHSVQMPSAKGNCSDGKSEYISPLARAAVAFGVSGIFLEIHENPQAALSDGPNSLKIDDLPQLLNELISIKQVIK